MKATQAMWIRDYLIIMLCIVFFCLASCSYTNDEALAFENAKYTSLAVQSMLRAYYEKHCEFPFSNQGSQKAVYDLFSEMEHSEYLRWEKSTLKFDKSHQKITGKYCYLNRKNINIKNDIVIFVLSDNNTICIISSNLRIYTLTYQDCIKCEEILGKLIPEIKLQYTIDAESYSTVPFTGACEKSEGN